MLVKDTMVKEVVVAERSKTLFEACEIMVTHHIDSLIIVEKRKIVGVLTEVDILRAIVAKKDLHKTLIGEVMSTRPITIGPHRTLEDAAEIMIRHRIRRLPVVEADQRLVGILTQTEITKAQPSLKKKFGHLAWE
jgi:CBS domain-containing protein